MPRLHSVVADWGAIGSAPLVLIGSALGLYDATTQRFALPLEQALEGRR